MDMPPSAVRYFAEKHLDEAYKRLSDVEDVLFKEGQEDRRAYEKFYNNLALFSGGTIALSITYLGYLKTLNRPLVHQWLLRSGWISLFFCLLFSMTYVLINLYYGHHFRQKELADAKRLKFETEAKEIPNMNLENLRDPGAVREFVQRRMDAAKQCAQTVAEHQSLEDRYLLIWTWAGRLARLGFVLGIGFLVVFAVWNG